ncbi:MAG: hypothetical protein GX247_00880 [Mollicutes bacterium]|jgi:uncharacterized protein (DUF934 family)|nr:hypothetical protein [Mollicutes bacterium]
MNRKETAVAFIKEKLEQNSFRTYKEIAEITGYHPKYILKLKKQILNNEIKLEHGNKNKIGSRALPYQEEMKIVNLYKRSNVSVRKFCQFYETRSYSCIYNVLKRNNLIKK